jgi:hypothetical protein
MKKWKGCGRMLSWSNLLPVFAWKDLEKPRKTSVRIADLEAEI